jgi:hypothetical protein
VDRCTYRRPQHWFEVSGQIRASGRGRLADGESPRYQLDPRTGLDDEEKGRNLVPVI